MSSLMKNGDGSYKSSKTKSYEIIKVNALDEHSSEFIVLLIKIWEKDELFEEGKKIVVNEQFNIKVCPIVEIYSNGDINDISTNFRSTWGAKVHIQSRVIEFGHSGDFDLQLKDLKRRGLSSYIVSDIISWAKSNSEYLNFNFGINIHPFGETEEDKAGVLKFYSHFNLYSPSPRDRSERIVSNLIEHRKEEKISLLLSLKDEPNEVLPHNLNQQIKSWFGEQYSYRKKIDDVINKLIVKLNHRTEERDNASKIIRDIRTVSYVILAVSTVIILIEYWLFKGIDKFLFTTLILLVGYLYILWNINQNVLK
jgi:hypothetical protein